MGKAQAAYEGLDTAIARGVPESPRLKQNLSS